MTKKIVTLLMCLFFSYNPIFASDYTSDKKQLEDYVEDFLEQTYILFQDDSISEDQLRTKVSKIIREHLYSKWMAKQTLGRAGRNLSKSQMENFEEVYADFVVNSYSSLVSSYNGEKGVLLRVKDVDNDLFIVDTEILNPRDNTKTIVKYLIHEIDKGNQKNYLVGDVIVEGVSIIDSQRSEFQHILLTKGFDFLIQDLKEKSKS